MDEPRLGVGPRLTPESVPVREQRLAELRGATP